jgi:hypothetical protein
MEVLDAKSQFENQLGGENAVGCNAVATLINLITNEKKEKNNIVTSPFKWLALKIN